MKLSLKLLIIIPALIFSILSATETKGQILSEVFKRMRAHHNALKTLRSSFTMTHYNAQLAESDHSRGEAIYTRSKDTRPALRVDWIKPFAESLSLVNGRYIFYQPRLKQAFAGIIGKNTKNEAAKRALSIIFASPAELKNIYIFKYLGTDTIKGGIKTFHLAIAPKERLNFMSAVELWVDSNGMVLQAKVFQHNKDSTTVLLSGLKKNEPVTAAALLIELPKDVKLLRTSAEDLAESIVEDKRAKVLSRTKKWKTAKRIKARKKRYSPKSRQKRSFKKH
jgi:outer membrane lipoprotein-sorting protein